MYIISSCINRKHNEHVQFGELMYCTILPDMSTSQLTREMSTNSSVSSTHEIPHRRGKRSLLSTEEREQNRRLKKQHIERRRRACISDKMIDLHRLTMSMIGCEEYSNPKAEKADILGTCHSVFQNVANLIHECPDMNAKLLEITAPLRQKLTVNISDNNKSLDHSTTMDNSLKVEDIENIKPPSPTHLLSRTVADHQRLAIPSTASAFKSYRGRNMHSTPVRAPNQMTPDSGLQVNNRYSSQLPSQFMPDSINLSLNMEFRPQYQPSVPSPYPSTRCMDSGMNMSIDSYLYSSQTGPSPDGDSLEVQTSIPYIRRDAKLWRPYLN